MLTTETITKTSPTSPATLGFGTTTTSPTSHLQYQPLPQQYLNNTPYSGGGGGMGNTGSMMRNSRSPPTSPETLSDSVVLSKQQLTGSNNPRLMNATSPTVTKLSKLYNQRHLHQGGGSISSAPTSLINANTTGTAYKENNFKPESGK